MEAIRPLDLFHSYDVWNQEGRCKDLPKNERDALTNRAMKVVAEHKIEGYVGEINRMALENKFGGKDAANLKVKHPYYLPFIWVINATMVELSKRGETSVIFYHEENEFMAEAKKDFDKRKIVLGCHAFEFIVAKKSEFVPLQCADAFAYFGMQKLRNWERPSYALNEADPTGLRILALRVSDEQILELSNLLKSKTLAHET